MLKFHSIVAGGMKSRFVDVWGSGQPGARRGGHVHQGIDIICKKGEKIFSPIDGAVIREAFPYRDDQNFRRILIKGLDIYSGYEIKMFYMNGLFSGRAEGGKLIGHAQNLTTRYPGITNHIHMEIYRSGVLMDPREAYMACF